MCSQTHTYIYTLDLGAEFCLFSRHLFSNLHFLHCSIAAAGISESLDFPPQIPKLLL